jgi:hypothetical protein
MRCCINWPCCSASLRHQRDAVWTLGPADCIKASFVLLREFLSGFAELSTPPQAQCSAKRRRVTSGF